MLRDISSYIVFRVVMFFGGLLPYKSRVFLCARMVSSLEPVLKIKKRTILNLDEIFPSVMPEEKIAIARGVSRNIAHHLVDILSRKDVLASISEKSLKGEGLCDLHNALKNRQPIIFVSGHFGCYEALRLKLTSIAAPLGGLYKPLSNKFINRFYVKTLADAGWILFEKNKTGYRGMINHLRSGGCVAILHDQHISNGVPIKFFGKTAHTGNSAAKLAIKSNAILLPVYGVRTGVMEVDFIVEKPIAHTNISQMTQDISQSLEGRVKKDMDQWIWNHRRWRKSSKPK